MAEDGSTPPAAEAAAVARIRCAKRSALPSGPRAYPGRTRETSRRVARQASAIARPPMISHLSLLTSEWSAPKCLPSEQALGRQLRQPPLYDASPGVPLLPPEPF